MGVSEGAGGAIVKYGILAALLIGGGLLIAKWWKDNNPFGQAQQKADEVFQTGRNLGGLLPEDTSVINQNFTDLWAYIRNLGGLLPENIGGNNQLTDTSGLLITSPDKIPPEADIIQMAKNAGAYHSGIEPIDSVLGLQGIGLSETILQDVSPTLMLVEREYNAPNVHTSEIVYQDVWGGIIGPNLAAGSDPDEVGACLARGGGWNWNTRECI